MSKFSKGDRVLVNGSQVATIHTYDEASGRLVLDQGVEGKGEHLIYGPIGTYHLQHLVSGPIGRDAEDDGDEGAAAEDDDSPKDEITTLGSL